MPKKKSAAKGLLQPSDRRVFSDWLRQYHVEAFEAIERDGLRGLRALMKRAKPLENVREALGSDGVLQAELEAAADINGRRATAGAILSPMKRDVENAQDVHDEAQAIAAAARYLQFLVSLQRRRYSGQRAARADAFVDKAQRFIEAIDAFALGDAVPTPAQVSAAWAQNAAQIAQDPDAYFGSEPGTEPLPTSEEHAAQLKQLEAQAAAGRGHAAKLARTARRDRRRQGDDSAVMVLRAAGFSAEESRRAAGVCESGKRVQRHRSRS